MATNRENERKYTTAISKGAAMVDEMRRLLEHWHPDESLGDFAQRVQDDGLVGSATAYRTRDIVRRVFAPRLLRPTNKPATVLKRILEAGLASNTFTDLLFLFSCRSDPLIYDFTIREYWTAVRRGNSVLTVQSGIDFLTEAHHDGRLENDWSDNVSMRISRCLLGMLRDVGFLRGDKGKKEILPYRMSDEGLAITARLLCEENVTDSSLCAHSDWALFGMNEQDVLQRLDDLGEHRGIMVQRAGSVVRFTWYVKSIEELIDVLT